MNEFYFSKNYISALNEFSQYISTILSKENKHVLMFIPEKFPNYVVMTKMDLQIMVSISANNEHIKIPEDEIGFSNLPEFVKFLNSFYNSSNNTSIQKIEYVNKYGQKGNYILLNNDKSTYHIALGKPGLFNENDKIIPSTPDKDLTKLVAKISINKNDIKEILNHIKLLGMPEEFALKLKNKKIYLYIKDNSGEKQFTKIIDSHNVLIESEFYDFNSDICLFPTKFLFTLDCFSCDFIILLRFIPDKNIMLLKSYSYLVYNENKNKQNDKKQKEKNLNIDMNLNIENQESKKIDMSPIGLFIGVSQSVQHVGINDYNIIE